MNEYEGHWITTFTGKKFHYLNPAWDEICIEDIAHALALTCRFGGHCQEFYSVAEHSFRVAMIVDKEDKLAALLHDAHEAYLHDVPRPIKFDMPKYQEIADKVQVKIYKVFNTYIHYPGYLKFADNTLLATEARDIMATMQDWMNLPLPLTLRIRPLNWQLAERIFLDFYSEYKGK